MIKNLLIYIDTSGRRVESFENGKIFIVKTKQNTFKTIYVL